MGSTSRENTFAMSDEPKSERLYCRNCPHPRAAHSIKAGVEPCLVKDCNCNDFFEPDRWENYIRKNIEILKNRVISLESQVEALRKGGKDG